MRVPITFAYADPPYPGKARKHYGCPEVDHAALIEDLGLFDAWALSSSSVALRDLLPLCPDDVRIAAWVKPFAAYNRVAPAYTWEPIIFRGARSGGPDSGKRTPFVGRRRDSLVANMTLQRGVIGAKPAAFCAWLIDLMGLEPDDDIRELFPATSTFADTINAWRLSHGRTIKSTGYLFTNGT